MPKERPTLSGDKAIDLWLKGRDDWNDWVEKHPEYNISFYKVDFSQYRNCENISEDKWPFSGFNFPNGTVGFEYNWIDESIKSIKSFCMYFNVHAKNYCFSTCSPGYVEYEEKNYNFRSVKKNDIEKNRKDWETGHCIDESLIEGWNTYLDRNGNGNGNGDIKGAFKAALANPVLWVVTDMDYQQSLEYFINDSNVNDCLYLKDGILYEQCDGDRVLES
jgi:hypothetical protein